MTAVKPVNPLDSLLADWSDTLEEVRASPGVPTPEAIERLILYGDALAMALRYRLENSRVRPLMIDRGHQEGGW